MKTEKKRKSRQRKILPVILLSVTVLLTGCGGKEQLWSELEKEAGEGIEESRDEVSSGEASSGEGQPSGETADESEKLPAVIFVHVCGAVKNPGVYELPAGSRGMDAVEAASGFSEDACQEYTNLAVLLTDGSMLRIPTREEASLWEEEGLTGEESNGTAAGGSKPVNLNTADIAQLCSLSGIGESRARDIISYREAHGGFKAKEEIMQVSGIGQKIYEKIEPYITV